MHNSNLFEKARDDRFEPTTLPSKNYKTWIAVLDLKTCFECADNHGRIFDINDITVTLPPLHPFCLESMESIEAGNATNNGVNGADYWLKYCGSIIFPDHSLKRLAGNMATDLPNSRRGEEMIIEYYGQMTG